MKKKLRPMLLAKRFLELSVKVISSERLPETFYQKQPSMLVEDSDNLKARIVLISNKHVIDN